MSLDIVRCPHCDQELAPFHGQNVARAGVRADLCPRCRGIWLDGRGATEVVSAFEELAARITGDHPAELEAGAAIARCPRCRAATRPLRFFELLLDVCLGCRGLWIDGEELLDLARTADRAEDLPAPLPREGGYRSGAVRALRAGEVLCKLCRVSVPLDAVTWTSSRGPICAKCAEASQPLEAPVEVQERARPAPLDLSGSRELLSALRIFFDAAMAIGGTCPKCRCHAASRCSH